MFPLFSEKWELDPPALFVAQWAAHRKPMEGGRWETRVTGAQGGDPLSLGASQVSSADVTIKAETLRAAGTRASTLAQPAVAVGVTGAQSPSCVLRRGLTASPGMQGSSRQWEHLA